MEASWLARCKITTRLHLLKLWTRLNFLDSGSVHWCEPTRLIRSLHRRNQLISWDIRHTLRVRIPFNLSLLIDIFKDIWYYHVGLRCSGTAERTSNMQLQFFLLLLHIINTEKTEVIVATLRFKDVVEVPQADWAIVLKLLLLLFCINRVLTFNLRLFYFRVNWYVWFEGLMV